MQKTLNCKGRIVSLKNPLVMGIINLNNDSFYTGSRSSTLSSTLEMVGQMLHVGADIIDIGYMSSKPGSAISDPKLEADVISTVTSSIKEKYPEAIISVDTLHSAVAQEAVLHGADMINDISAGSFDEAMLDTVAALGVPFIMMHMQGLPANMQHNPQYNDVVYEVLVYLKDRVRLAQRKGIADIIIDPGFGFGKTLEHNFTLLRHLQTFKILDVPILVGLSRKSMIWKTLETSPETALNGTTALNFHALQQGANILRVHDVKEAVECVKLYKSLMENGIS